MSKSLRLSVESLCDTCFSYTNARYLQHQLAKILRKFIFDLEDRVRLLELGGNETVKVMRLLLDHFDLELEETPKIVKLVKKTKP